MVTAELLLERCAPQVSPALMVALVRAESAWQPLAIGMDRGHGSVKQPASLEEAVRTARELAAAGRKFSVGLAQVHVGNVALYGMRWEQAFDACSNLAVGQQILWSFYHRATASGYTGVAAVWAALRGYNSGGIHRAVSDEYAHRILAYAASVPPQVQIGNASPAGAGRQPAVPLPSAALSSAPRAAVSAICVPPTPSVAASTEPGESVEIFAKKRVAGF